eukprot:8910219-Lingulodinium_polyedra.AAC.1
MRPPASWSRQTTFAYCHLSTQAPVEARRVSAAGSANAEAAGVSGARHLCRVAAVAAEFLRFSVA